jgi:hypothetical protein
MGFEGGKAAFKPPFSPLCEAEALSVGERPSGKMS